MPAVNRCILLAKNNQQLNTTQQDSTQTNTTQQNNHSRTLHNRTEHRRTQHSRTLHSRTVHNRTPLNRTGGCPIGVCVTLSGKFPYAPYNYLTNVAGSEQTLRCRSHIFRLQCSKTENIKFNALSLIIIEISNYLSFLRMVQWS